MTEERERERERKKEAADGTEESAVPAEKSAESPKESAEESAGEPAEEPRGPEPDEPALPAPSGVEGSRVEGSSALERSEKIADEIRFCPDCANVLAAEAELCPRCGFRLAPEREMVPRERRWYYSRKNVTRLLFYLGPLAIPLLWLSPNFAPAERSRYTVLTLALTAFFLAWLVIIIWICVR